MSKQETSTAKHTPIALPCRLADDPASGWIYDESGILVVQAYGSAMTAANRAKYIVQAVNSHDQLLEVLTKIVEKGAWQEWIEEARAALKAAEGRQ